MTDVGFKPLTEAEKIFKELIWDPALHAGELLLETDVPVPFALPVIKQLDEFMLGELSDWLFEKFRLLVDVTAIKLVNSAHQSSYESASEQLMVLALDKGVDSDEYKKARDAAKLEMSRWTDIAGGQ